MKTIIATAAATLFAASVSAGSIYNGFEQGNSDLQGGYASSGGAITASQPGVGSGFDRYQGWADGNHDLFEDTHSTPLNRSAPADVYRGFTGNPDL